MTGPATSEGASADTQVWSSGGSSSSPVRVSSVEADGLAALGLDPEESGSRCLRFFGLSPLKVKGLTILRVWYLLREVNGLDGR